MNGPIPVFFFSYSQADTDKYLDRFFEDLRKRVSDLAGLAIKKSDADSEEKFNKVGFRDQSSIKPGHNWREKIGAAIQRNAVLVCIYSPNFFSRQPDKEFCGKELTAFLMRDSNVRFAPGIGKYANEVQLQGWRNILPIVWRKFRHLQRNDLPPYVLRSVQWALDNASASQTLNTRYLDVGMHRIAMEIQQPGEYDDILDYFAEQIDVMSKDPPPPWPTIPNVEALRNTFWDRPTKVDREAIASPIDEPDIAAATRGPTRMLVIVARPGEDATMWSPYKNEKTVAAVFEEFANQEKLTTEWLTLDAAKEDFVVQAQSALDRAAGRSIRSVLVVDPLSLADANQRAALAKLLTLPCRAGLLVPTDSSDRDTVRLIEQHRAILQPSDKTSDWVVRISIGNIAQFRIAVGSVADDIRARIVKADVVQQNPPDNDGPTTRPRIANRLDTERVT